MIGMNADVVILHRDTRKEVDKTADRVLRRAARQIARDIAKSLVRRNRPSYPGETPTVRNTRMRVMEVEYNRKRKTASIKPKQFGSSQIPATLEHGNSRIKPRPFMAPALERNRKAIIDGWKNAIK